jgi:hypothetical protein
VSDVIERVEQSLVAAHGREYSTDAGPRRAFRYLAAAAAALVVAVPATAATTGWDPFHDPDRRLPRPSVSELPPATSLTSQLAVLRRNQTAADRSAPVQAALRGFDDESSGVQLEAVRLLPGGAVLVPVKRFEPRGPGGGRPEDRRDDAVCLYSPGSGRTGGTACFTAAQVREGQAITSQGATVDGLVPDGVAGVRLRSAGGTAEAAVRDNYFAVELPPIAGPGGVPFVRADAAEWLDREKRKIAAFDYRKRPADEPAAP